MSAMEWPRFKHKEVAEAVAIGAGKVPHICNVPDCPGPRLVARLEAAERVAEALRRLLTRMGEPGGECDHPRRSCADVNCTGVEVDVAVNALSAYESASEPVKERT
jgi:hypothetical protein